MNEQQTQQAPQQAPANNRGILSEVMDATERLDVIMGKRWGIEPQHIVAYVRSHIGLWRGAPDGFMVPRAIVDQFLSVCREHELNPAKKEVYGFYHPDKGLQFGVQIDGWVTLANRQPEFDGWELEHERDDEGTLQAVTCLLYRKDRSRPIKVRVKHSEWYTGSNPNWRDRPEWMLEIKAIKQAIRLGFGFGGIQDADDVNRIIQETEKRREKPAPTAAKVARTTLKDLTPGKAPPDDEYENQKYDGPPPKPDEGDEEPAGGDEPEGDRPPGSSDSAPPAEEAPPADQSEAAQRLEAKRERNRKFGSALLDALDEKDVSVLEVGATLRAGGFQRNKADLEAILEGEAAPLTEDELILLHQKKGLNIKRLQAVLAGE